MWRASATTRKLEEVVHERGQPVALGAQLPVVHGHLTWTEDDTVVERLDDGLDARERRAEVVRDPRDELPARVGDGALALEARVELLLHRLELACERRELLGGRRLDTRPQVSFADLTSRLDQAQACCTQPRRERERRQDADGSGRDDDHCQRGHRARRLHHQMGRRQCAGGHRADGRQRHDHSLDGERSAGRQP
jgi:hypothetical protein